MTMTIEEIKAREEEIKELKAKRTELVNRLDTGAGKILAAQEQGQDVTEWEDFWIKLLHEYERVYDRLVELGDTGWTN